MEQSGPRLKFTHVNIHQGRTEGPGIGSDVIDRTHRRARGTRVQQSQQELSGIIPAAYYIRTHPGGRFIIIMEDLEDRGIKLHWMETHVPWIMLALALWHWPRSILCLEQRQVRKGFTPGPPMIPTLWRALDEGRLCGESHVPQYRYG
jgi:hypothetical protein